MYSRTLSTQPVLHYLSQCPSSPARLLPSVLDICTRCGCDHKQFSVSLDIWTEKGLYCKCWTVLKNVSTPCGQHWKQKTGGGQGWDRTIEQLRRWFRWKVTTVPVQVDSCYFVEQLLCILDPASVSVSCESRIWARKQVCFVSKGPHRPIKSSRMADQDLVNGLSKLVGYSIVLPAFFVLIPQILKVNIHDWKLHHSSIWCFQKFL